MHFRPARAVVIVVAAFLAAPLVIASPQEGGASAVCPAGLRTMEGVGLVCPRASGLYEVYSAELESLGFIHGTDPVPTGDEIREAGIASATSVQCMAGEPGSYHIQVIYARASDDTNQYAALLGTVRSLVAQADQKVKDSAIATGSTAALRVKCVDGLVEVKNEPLPTLKAAASFSTIVSDLRAKGYNDGKVKYWVFYDDTGACSCGGTGHVYGDDSPGIANSNNGNAGAMFAVTFGYDSTRIMLHELGHNMGAVQNSAANSTGAFHCVDGLDIMCYADGGPNSARYSSGVCSVEVWDCNRNDYFHAHPAPGSYLATHWNLGNPINRFIHFGAPLLTSLACPPDADVGVPLSCTFSASDDSSGVRYAIEWGDGTTTHIPSASTFTPPGTIQTAGHTYQAAAHNDLRLSVVDTDGFEGDARSLSMTAYSSVPVMDLLACPTATDVGTQTSCSFRSFSRASGVRYAIDWGDGASSVVPPSGFVAPGTTRSAAYAYASIGDRIVTVVPSDEAGNVGAASTFALSVLADITPPKLTVHDPATGKFYAGCGTNGSWFSTGRALVVGTVCVRASASDAGSGVARVEAWLDGVLRATDETAPYQMEFPVPNNGVVAVVIVKAIDGAGIAREVRRTIDMAAMPPT